MKKVISLLLTAVLSCSMLLSLPGVVIKASAAVITDPETGLIFDTDRRMVTGYTGAPTNLVIPSYIDGTMVSAIGANAFKNCVTLASVTITNFLSTIYSNAFQGCTQLTNLTIGPYVDTISAYAFSGCSKLSNVTIQIGLESIGNYAFQSCTSLVGIILPDSLTSIGLGAFKGCTKLANITIPNKVTSIGMYGFQNCTLLKNITIPNSVTSIGALAFSGTTGLKMSGYAGSYAQTYAASNSITFIIISNSITVTLTKYGTNSVVNIKNFEEGQKYQIWSYQKVTSDLLLNNKTTVSANQWILSKEYSLSSEADIVEADGSISFYIDNFTSPDGNYTIDVRVIDENDNYVGECMDAFSPAETQEVKIAKVLVDGNFYSEQESKEIKTGAIIDFSVVGNGVADTVYSATIIQGGRTLAATDSGNNFKWNIASEKAGKYTVKFTASNETSTDERTITINLFSKYRESNFGIISAVNVIGEKSADVFNVTINPTITSGQEFYYKIGEPGTTPIVMSAVSAPGTNYVQTLALDNYGIYSVYGYVKRTAVSSYDDAFIRTVENKRSDNLSIQLTSNFDAAGGMTTINMIKGEDVSFSAEATLGEVEQESIQYSYWRYDAKGFVLVKGWSYSNDFDWIPARVGQYTIQVRAKGPGSLSYEVQKSITVNVTDANESIAQGVIITTNSAELNANAKARTLLTIKANATATNGSDLLYKFYVSDELKGINLTQEYSSKQFCTWVPRKAGIYEISVFVKNKESYGKYDAIQTFTVTVIDPGSIIE